MLHIILFILKIIGLLALIVIGLILAVLLLVLFVPVRYQANGSFYGKVKGNARFTWLLHILSVSVLFEEDLIVAVRLFGFRILKPKKVDEEMKEAEEMMVQALEVRMPEETGEEPEPADELQPAPSKKPVAQLPPQRKEEEKGENSRRHRWFSKIKEKLSQVLLKLKFIFRKICDTLKTIKEKKTEISGWISSKENQKTAKLIFRQGKRLIRHILPVRGKGNITFGFEDPYLTGQVLTYASVIYPLCHKYLNVYPVFDRAVFTAEGTFRGRVRLGTVLLIGGRLLLDKNVRILLKKLLG